MSERILATSEQVIRIREVVTLRDDGFLATFLLVVTAGSFVAAALTLSKAPLFSLLLGVIGVALGGALLVTCFLLRGWEIDVERSRVVKTSAFLGHVSEEVLPRSAFDRVED